MIKKINCLIVDDDEIDLLTTALFLEEYPNIEIKGRFDSAEKALAFAQKTLPDLLILDIDMPGMNGLELREQLMNIPACIFITAYPDYALAGFDLAALDFLVKPFSAERFAKTMARLNEFHTIRQKAALLNHTLGGDTIFIKDGHQQIKLQLHEIIYVEALNNYTSIVTSQRKYAVHSPLSSLIKEKVFSNFIRIHRSYAVQKHYIRKVSSEELLVDETVLPIGRSYKDSLGFLK